MTLAELKAFIESTEGQTDEISAYLQGLHPVTVARAQSFADTPEGKSWLDSVKDKHLQKGLETWKSNNLDALLDAEIKRRFPEKDPKDIEVERLKHEIDAMKTEKQRESLTNKAMKLASEKGLPLELVGFFVGSDEDATLQNLKSLEDIYNTSVQKSLENRLKTDGYTPPVGGGNAKSLEDLSMDEYIKARNK